MAEKDSLPCPGCHTPLPPEATGCQICMRPRTRQEIMRGYAKLRDDKARKRRRPFQIMAALLLLGGAGWLAMTHGDRLASAAAAAGSAIGRWTDDMRDPSNYAAKAPPPPEPAPAPPAAPGAAVAPESAMRAQLFPEDYQPPPAADAPAAARPARPAGPKPLAKNAWRVSGTVYDLASLDPVPGSKVTFLLDEKEPHAAATDESGAYEVDLPKGDGWTVHVIAPDRRRGQILDIDPSYRVRDADERRAVLENLTAGDLIPAPVGWKRSSSKVKLDLFAIPHRWTGPSPP
jgi:hypothetical protein